MIFFLMLGFIGDLSCCGVVGMVKSSFETEELNCLLRSVLSAVGGRMEVDQPDWKDLPLELLLRIVSLIDDDRAVVVAAGVCTGWREAICSGLTHFSLSWCKAHMNELALSLVPKFSRLQVLSLRQNIPQLEDQSVVALADHCHDLRELDLSKCLRLTDRSLYALAYGCPSLTRLNISGCSSFNDTALSFLASACPRLKNLNLCGCVKAASDIALQAIAYNCPQLQSLNLGWCEGVSDVGVKSLAFGCPDLRAIDLCGCILITDESVIALASSCHGLRSLGLYYCQNITDRAMYSLASNRCVKGKPDLWKSVFNSYSNGSTEEGLRNLNISQCTALTPPAVQAVCDSFPALHTCFGRHSLIISGCLSLTSVHCACSVRGPKEGRVLSSEAH